MPNWNGVAIPEAPQIKIPNSIPQNFNWNSYISDPKGTFNKFKGAREVNRINWKGYRTASATAKKIILSSPSKKFISDAMKQVKSLRKAKKVAEDAKKIADAVKKTSDIATKVQEALLKNVPGSAALDKASRIGGILGILSAIGLVVLLKFQEFTSSRTFDDLLTTQIDLTKVNTIATNAGLKLKTIDAKIQKFEKELDINAKDYYRLNKQQETFGKDTAEIKKKVNDITYETREGRKIVEGKVVEAKKQANDALYETRQGKTILEGKISESKKQSNDALYETRQNKFSLDGKIQQINAEIARISSKASDGFQSSINATISKLQTELTSVRASLATTKPATPVDVAAINANAVAAARAFVAPLQSAINGLALQTTAALNLGGVAINGISNLAQGIASANVTANQALAQSKIRETPNLAPLQQQLDDKFNRFVADNNKALGIKDLAQSDLSKEFERKLADFQRQSGLTSEQRFQEFQRENNKALGIKDLQLSDLSKEFDRKNADFARLSTLTAEQRFEEFQRENRATLGLVKTDLKTVEADIKKIDTGLKEQEKVNTAALPKLDQILGILPFIPARVADAVRPDIPTLPQIENAAATGTCRTTQTGGCMSKALDNNAANINNNTNNKVGNVLDVVNTGANAALLAGQQTILQRLGNQVPGGISGFMNRIVKSQWVDRAVNLVTMTAAVHNVIMLSDQAATTFFGILDNVLAIPALIIDPNAKTIDTKQAFGGLIDGFFKSIFGVTEWAEIKKRWQTANRIYQAAANGANEIRSIGGNIISAVEQTARLTGKGFNAMQDEGLLSEANWDYSPENLKLKGGMYAKFGKLADGINIATEGLEAIESITSEIRSAVDSANQIKENATEIDTAVKELTAASKTKREEEVEALPAKSYSWEDLI